MTKLDRAYHWFWTILGIMSIYYFVAYYDSMEAGQGLVVGVWFSIGVDHAMMLLTGRKLIFAPKPRTDWNPLE